MSNIQTERLGHGELVIGHYLEIRILDSGFVNYYIEYAVSALPYPFSSRFYFD